MDTNKILIRDLALCLYSAISHAENEEVPEYEIIGSWREVYEEVSNIMSLEMIEAKARETGDKPLRREA